VHTEIQYDLLKLRLVRQQRRQLVTQSELERHRARESFGHQRHEVVAQLIEINRRITNLGFAAERKDLFYKTAGALGCAVDLEQTLLQNRRFSGALKAELRVAVNDCEEIVEIVRDAAG